MIADRATFGMENVAHKGHMQICTYRQHQGLGETSKFITAGCS